MPPSFTTPSNAHSLPFWTGMGLLCLLFSLTHTANAAPVSRSTPPTRAHLSTRTKPPFTVKRARRRVAQRKPSSTTVVSPRRCRVKWNIEVRPDFKDATIMTVVKWISKQTCQNFIISNRISNRGNRLHIISETPVRLRDAYRAFFSALESNQMTAIKVGRFWKIIYARDARKQPTRTYTKGKFRHSNREEVVTYLYRLKHLNASQVSGLLRRLISSSGSVVPYSPSSVVLITDYASNLYRVLRILKSIDLVEAESKSKVYVLKVRHAQAQEVAQKIRQLFKVGTRRRTRRTRRRFRRRRRTRRTKRTRRTRRTTRKKSDDDDEDAYILKKLVADERTNQIITLCNPRALKRLSKLIRDLDTPLAGEGQIWVHYLKFATANEISQTLSQITKGTRQRRRRRYRRRSRQRKASELFEGEIKVTADKASNALVVVASRRDYNSLLRVISKLDIPRKQVFIEIVILEVSLNKSRELGLTFHNAQNVTGDTAQPTVGILGTRLAGLNSLVLDPSALMGLAFGLRGAEVPGTSGILGANTGALPSFGVMLRAIQSNTDVDIVSTPHILATANKEATLQVGQNVPFIAGTSIGGGAGLAGVPQFRNIQRQDVALTLKIKPQVDSGDYVRMDFEQELTELAGQDPELGPTTTKRKIKTVVMAKDRQTVVIGGLVSKKITNGVSKVPVLGDIPLIGALFRLTKKSYEKRNLLVFLTPYIINSQNDFKKIYKQKLKERKEFLRLFYAGKGSRVPNQTDFSRKRGLIERIRYSIKRGKAETKLMQGGGNTTDAIKPKSTAAPAKAAVKSNPTDKKKP